jgi:hypothetical protein
MLLSKKDKDGSASHSPMIGRNASVNDRPIDKRDYESHWTKKTKGAYLCGIGRWFKICRNNLSKDEEHNAKLFQTIMMLIFGIICIGFTILVNT